MRDLCASVVSPVKELKGFKKIALRAGESAVVTFKIDESTLAFYTADGVLAAERGKFIIMAGGSSQTVLSAELRLEV